MFKFQDCEFEIGKPVCVLCMGFRTRGLCREPDSWFPLRAEEIWKLREFDAITKVKKSYVSKIAFSPEDRTKAVRLDLENGICLHGGETYFLGHSVQEALGKYQEFPKE